MQSIDDNSDTFSPIGVHDRGALLHDQVKQYLLILLSCAHVFRQALQTIGCRCFSLLLFSLIACKVALLTL